MTPNIKIQRSGPGISYACIRHLPAADLGVRRVVLATINCIHMAIMVSSVESFHAVDGVFGKRSLKTIH